MHSRLCLALLTIIASADALTLSGRRIASADALTLSGRRSAFAPARARRLASLRGGASMSLGQRYACASLAHPHAIAAATAGCVLMAADVTCQCAVARGKRDGSAPRLDWRRTAGLTLFGAVYYGLPAKLMYMWYDRRFGSNVLLTSLFDCYVHFPFLLLPSFYLITQTVGKGSSLRTAWARMRAEWRTAVAGSAVFWTPASFVSFGMVPQHSRVLVIAAFSFVHKTWLSWLSNRESVGAGAVAPSA